MFNLQLHSALMRTEHALDLRNAEQIIRHHRDLPPPIRRPRQRWTSLRPRRRAARVRTPDCIVC